MRARSEVSGLEIVARLIESDRARSNARNRAEIRHVGIPTLRRWTIRICAPRMVRQLWEILIRVI